MVGYLAGKVVERSLNKFNIEAGFEGFLDYASVLKIALTSGQDFHNHKIFRGHNPQRLLAKICAQRACLHAKRILKRTRLY